jgi:hypothetical protein
MQAQTHCGYLLLLQHNLAAFNYSIESILETVALGGGLVFSTDQELQTFFTLFRFEIADITVLDFHRPHSFV